MVYAIEYPGTAHTVGEALNTRDFSLGVSFFAIFSILFGDARRLDKNFIGGS